MHARYDARDPEYNPSQPVSYNSQSDLPKVPPEGARKGALGDAYDFYRMGYDGELRGEKRPVPMVMKRGKEEAKTFEQCAQLMSVYMDDKFGAEQVRRSLPPSVPHSCQRACTTVPTPSP